jgi:hypothetical protein
MTERVGSSAASAAPRTSKVPWSSIANASASAATGDGATKRMSYNVEMNELQRRQRASDKDAK